LSTVKPEEAFVTQITAGPAYQFVDQHRPTLERAVALVAVTFDGPREIPPTMTPVIRTARGALR
jgi:hypothetical protein